MYKRQGIGGVCSAIVSLLKGNFKEAAGLAKEGFTDIGEGVLGANPVSVAYNTLQGGNYSAAWEKGKQAGRDSWASSMQPDDTDAANKLMPEIPEPVTSPATNVPDFDALMKKIGTTSKGKTGTKKSATLRLDDEPVTANLGETAEYTAATRKLEPATIPVKAAEVTAPAAQVIGKTVPLNSAAPATGKIDERTQTYDGEETNYLADIMQNVRKIAAAVLVPLTIAAAPVDEGKAKEAAPVNVSGPAVGIPDIAVSMPDIPDIPTPNISDAYNVENIRETNNQFATDNSRTYNDSGRSIQIGKVCDEVVIHVANTDQKGGDTIRQEIMNILEELGEG